MNRFALLLAALLACATLSPVAVTHASGSDVETMDAAAVEAASHKVRIYGELLAQTQRAAESWRRYQSWVSPTTGPTGKERAIYGLYSVPEPGPILERARAASAASPAFGLLDTAALRAFTTYWVLAPLMNSAARYYENRDYLTDGFEAGRAMHPRLVTAATAYMAARAELETALRPARAMLDERALDLLEQREGRGVSWQVRRVMLEARLVMDVLYGDSSKGDIAALNAAIERYAVAVAQFDAYAEGSVSSVAGFEDMPSTLLARLQDYQRAFGDASLTADPGRVAAYFDLMVGAARPYVQARPGAPVTPG